MVAALRMTVSAVSGRGRCAALALALLPASAPALNVVWDAKTSAESRKWADGSYFRVQMEAIAPQICRALYEGHPREKLHENFTITLYASPDKGGNPAFASGRRITWKVGEHPRGDASGGIGCICHEMTHVLDMGSDGVFTEAMADWVRNYKVWYPRCTSPSHILDIRYSALRGGRHYGKYMAGANFIDFMTQNYGEGTIYRILQGYREHGKNPWMKVFGKDLDGLLAEWKQMQTIYDPVYQWSYTGTVEGKVRHDRKFCSMGPVSANDTSDRSGAWLYGSSGCTLGRVTDGNVSIALHGCLPKGGQPLAIASLGSGAKGNGKAVLLATSSRADTIVALVIATPPGSSCSIVSSTPVPVPSIETRPHSIILAVRGGDDAVVVVDGAPAARIDMKSRCGGCTFTPAFAVGGMVGGIGVQGVAEPRGEGGIRLDDVRVFDRTFRGRETKQYATVFHPGFRPAAAVSAVWTGPNGGDSVDLPSNWYCVNSVGEKITAVPAAETAVRVFGRNLPSIPKGTRFPCRSFTVAGWAVVDEKSIDLRGVKVVDVEDNTRIITKNGHALAVSGLRADRVRIDGSVAVESAMKVSGRLELAAKSVLRLPAQPDRALVGSIAVSGDGVAYLRPGVSAELGKSQKIMCLGSVPEDFSSLALHGTVSPADATFKMATDGRHLTIFRIR